MISLARSAPGPVAFSTSFSKMKFFSAVVIFRFFPFLPPCLAAGAGRSLLDERLEAPGPEEALRRQLVSTGALPPRGVRANGARETGTPTSSVLLVAALAGRQLSVRAEVLIALAAPPRPPPEANPPRPRPRPDPRLDDPGAECCEDDVSVRCGPEKGRLAGAEAAADEEESAAFSGFRRGRWRLRGFLVSDELC